jgi:hypothetical protein
LNFGAGVAVEVLPLVVVEGVLPKVPPVIGPPRPTDGGSNVLPELLDPAPLGVPDTPDDGIPEGEVVEAEPVVEGPELGAPEPTELPPLTTPPLGSLLVVVEPGLTELTSGAGRTDVAPGKREAG